MLAAVRSPGRLEGLVVPPGDKSISHRALILNALASGPARVSGLSTGADLASTIGCLGHLGVEVAGGRVLGTGLRGLRPSRAVLDCGNSGTTMRLLAGLLAAQAFESRLAGDESLSRRPMDRVIEPLRLMGARAEPGPPLLVGGQGRLRGIDYRCPVASAQVRSALLLAGLYAEGRTTVTLPAPARDHTELMLRAMGADVVQRNLEVSVAPTRRLRPLDVRVPGDISAAAFWLVAGALHPSARLRIAGVGMNPSRTGVLRLLRRGVGVTVRELEPRLEGLEPVADLLVETAVRPRAFEVTGAEAPSLIDELPVLAVAATQLSGTTRIRGAGELRRKESDRIATMAAALRAMGARIVELEDGWEISGPSRLEGARVHSLGDHRVAMALAVAGLLAAGVTEIEDAECAAVSDPGFWDELDRLC